MEGKTKRGWIKNGNGNILDFYNFIGIPVKDDPIICRVWTTGIDDCLIKKIEGDWA